MAGLNLETFCKSLHGLTLRQIEREVDRKIDELKAQARASKRNKKGKDATYVVYDSQRDEDTLEQLMEFVVHGYSQAIRQPTDAQKELFREVARNVKSAA